MAPRIRMAPQVASVTLDATGYGFCSVYVPSGVIWEVDLVTVATAVIVTPQVLQPKCTIYYDTGPNPVKFLESTSAGGGNSSDSKYTMMGGEALTAEWAGGALPDYAGVLATLTVRGFQIQVM